MEMRTPHFRVLYSQGQDSLARATGRILESQYPVTSRLTGGKLKKFPVILNDYNDRSNGYVSPLLFRSEIEVAPIKGKNLNPRTGGWLENVLPHELVHAQHMNVMPMPGLSWAFSLFSPDIGRGLNTFAHSGFLEGIAVYHESTVAAEGGRGNLSSFVYDFDANWRSEGSTKRWGLGTSLSPSGSTHPMSRHYIGGYQYSKWLVDTYGEKSIRDIIDFHSRWPFLGFGVANWIQTGDTPLQMKNSFNLWYDSSRVVERPTVSAFEKRPKLDWKGARLRRPLWVGNEHILFYGSAYNRTSGFHLLNIESEDLRTVAKTATVEDAVYIYDASSDELIYSVYDPHPFHENRSVSRIYRHPLKGGEPKPLSDSERLYAPSYHDGTLDALGYYRETSVWLRLNDGRFDSVLTIHPNQIIQVQARPGTDEYAVIANKNGLQAIWFIQRDNEDRLLSSVPDIRFSHGSVLDIAWSSDGHRLLFTTDTGLGVQLYEYDAQLKAVTRLDSGRPVILEPSMSPDARNIAYIFPYGEEYLIGIMPYDGFGKSVVPIDVWQADVTENLARGRLGEHLYDVSQTWSPNTYRAGIGWLKPRAVGPFMSNSSELVDTRYGISLQSSGLLRKHAYSLDVSVSNRRLWHELNYQYSGIYPGFIVSTGSEPQNGYLRTGGGIEPVIIDDRSTRLSIPFRWLFKQNVETSILSLRPEIQFRSIKAIDGKTGKSMTEPKGIQTLRGTLTLGLRLEQALRDVQPRNGLVVFADGRQDLKTYLDEKGRALRAGVDMYLPVLSSNNHGLQMRTQILTQGGGLYFGSSTLHRNQFLNTPYQSERNLTNLQVRYAIPLVYPDKGSFLIPWYVERSWLVVFTNTVSPFGGSYAFNPIKESRTSIGAEWRFITGFPNFRIDIGIGLGYELLRNEYVVFVQ